MLRAANLSKSFAGRVLFGGLNWQVGPKAKVALIGDNGAGKSTLMQILAGQQAADDGQILKASEATVGYLPQEAPRHNTETVLGRALDGARHIVKLHDHIEQLQADLQTASPTSAMELADALNDAQAQFDMLDGASLKGRAESILVGLGFAAQNLHHKCHKLSGGWWMRVELARLLVMQPAYLLLDEPTNHLDAQATQWLESYLVGYPGACVVVSHDRYFINRTAEQICQLSEDGIACAVGNYDDFVELQAAMAEQHEAERVRVSKKAQALTDFIARFGAKATKAKQAQSRAKQLSKLTMPERAKKPKKAPHFNWPKPPRCALHVVRAQQVNKSFGERHILKDVSLEVTREERVAILGDNGAGKSTILKLLAGIFRPNSGQITLGEGVVPFYFAQHQLDQLKADNSVITEMQEHLPDQSPTRIRGLLGTMGFREESFATTVKHLSGGEKSRLALAKMLAKPANLLLLDEPTNHLDLNSRDAVEQALANFDGAVVCVSHDKYFINRVATRIIEITNGRAHEYLGDYDYYLWKKEQDAQLTAAKSQGRMLSPPTSPAPSTFARNKVQARKERQHLRTVERIENDIAQAEARLKDVDEKLCDPAVFADATEAKRFLSERSQLADEVLPELMATWERLLKEHQDL